MKNYIGIDIGKYTLDIFMNNQTFTYKNTPADIKRLLTFFEPRRSKSIIIFEPTGGYERKLSKALIDNEFFFHKTHPNKVRDFARAKGLRAKTDKLDAKLLCEYAQCMELESDVRLASENTEKLAALLKRREELMKQQLQEENRLETLEDSDIKKSIRRHIKFLKTAIKSIEENIDTLKKTDKDIQQRDALLRTVKGVGDMLSNTLIAYVPELGRIDNKSLASLIGLAPYNHDSGTLQKRRFIVGGRGQVRNMLYMAALSCIQYNEDLKAFYQRLKRKGKPSKVALTAVMRKLLMVLNSVMRRQEPWQEKSPFCA